MSELSIVWLEEETGPCAFCGDDTGIGAVGWHQGEPSGPVCDACMLERESILGALLKQAKAVDNGVVN